MKKKLNYLSPGGLRGRTANRIFFEFSKIASLEILLLIPLCF